ncbi:MAG: succinylglutamate desuccinylase/aspartoacylase family protein, partial [Asticcacaulis sp.]|nr:succinylglutamate desuccinylase/aspartoacylase family protein [Asticcacaulis sp.]
MKSVVSLICAALLLTPILATSAPAATVYTGDRIDGAQVIDRLDVADQPTGTTHLWFRALDNATGQAWYVPVIVVKGAKPGPKFLLTAGIHGDELNGIAVIQGLVRDLDPDSLRGTLVAVPGLNAPGLLRSTRTFASGHTGAGGNLNRLIPSDPKATEGDSDASGRYAARLWSQIFIG